MKITNLRISNFRAIRNVEIEDTGSAVVIAGPNGSGKSCILDAIRLFKSLYGSYQQSELALWSNEFQLDWQREPGDLRPLLRDRRTRMSIDGEIEFSKREKEFLLGDGRWMVRELTWKHLYPDVTTHQGQLRTIPTPRVLDMERAVEVETGKLLKHLESELVWRRAKGLVTVDPSGRIGRENSLALQLAFSFFIPERLGIIDYHGSHRKYEREQLRTIALEESDEEEKVKSSALYNYEAKYANLKSAMASEYVRELIERDAGSERTTRTKPLSTTLQELFAMFLPGKKFRGPVAVEGGELAFPVWVDEDTQHDINELSSGEKEILFAYLRARSLSPRQSVLLIDEPELHLNPGLVQGLPQFYEKHIGRDLENQIWLVTHSDRFLREAIETTGMSVYHMQHVNTATRSNQLREIESKKSVESLLIDLVGELAAYRPDGKVVFLESEDSQFDRNLVTRLFPDDAKEINFLSGGGKTNVRKLQDTIDAMAKHDQVQADVFSIVDPDNDIWRRKPRSKGRHLEWPVYHIENFLLEEDYIKEALGHVQLEGAERIRGTKIGKMMEDGAQGMIDALAVGLVRDTLWRKLRKAINLNLGEDEIVIQGLAEKFAGAASNVQSLGATFGDEENIRRMFEKAHKQFHEMWADGLWKIMFPGRSILRKLCEKLGGNVDYRVLRNAIVGAMAKNGHQPAAMTSVIRTIRQV